MTSVRTAQFGCVSALHALQGQLCCCAHFRWLRVAPILTSHARKVAAQTTACLWHGARQLGYCPSLTRRTFSPPDIRLPCDPLNGHTPLLLYLGQMRPICGTCQRDNFHAQILRHDESKIFRRSCALCASRHARRPFCSVWRCKAQAADSSDNGASVPQRLKNRLGIDRSDLSSIARGWDDVPMRLADDILNNVADLPMTDGVSDYRARAAAVQYWKSQLQRGRLPELSRVDFPIDPFKSKFAVRFAKLMLGSLVCDGRPAAFAGGLCTRLQQCLHSPKLTQSCASCNTLSTAACRRR